MPVAERPAHARPKGLSKFKEKRKTSPFVLFLVCGVLVMITSDITLVILNCMQNCPVRKCTVASDLDEKGVETSDVANQLMQDYCIVIEPPPDLEQRFELSYYVAKPNQDNDNPTCDGSNSSPQDVLYGIDWDDGGENTVPNRKNMTIYEDVSTFVMRILHEFALYKDHNAVDVLTSDDTAYNHKAMFDSVLFVSSF